LQWTDPKNGEISSGYREDGYFPEAFINMLALLGWNPGDEREFFTLEQLIEAFSIDKVGKSGSKFDQEKAKWFNHHYLVEKSNEELAELFQAVLAEKNIDPGQKDVAYIVGLVKERVNFVSELWDQSSFFFLAPEDYDPKTVKKRWKTNSFDQMKELYRVLESVTEFTSKNTEEAVKEWIEENEYGMGVIMNAFRLLVVGAAKGPHLFDIIAVIGKEESLERINRGLNVLGKKEAN